MKPETLPIPDTRVISMYAIFSAVAAEFMAAPLEQYDIKAHAKVVRIRKAAYEANYWLEAGTRNA